MAAPFLSDKTAPRRRFLGSKHIPTTSMPVKIRFARFLKNFIISGTAKDKFKRIFLKSKKRMILSAMIFFLLIGGCAGGFFAYQWQTSPRAVYYRKLNAMTDQVNKYVPLPKDEQPVIATISNTRILPHEAFFSNAQDGDKILMYKKHQEAILYRPSTGQVITQATLNFQDTQPTPVQQVAGAATASAKIIPSLPVQAVSSAPFHPQGKILVEPQL